MSNLLAMPSLKMPIPALHSLYPPPPADCVLYLPGYPPMGETISDHSGEGNDGTIYGATWVRLPRGLWCLDFDGSDDYVKATSSFGDVNFKNTVFRMKTWVRFNTLGTFKGFYGIIPLTGTNFGVQIIRSSTDKIQVVFQRLDSNVTGRVILMDDTTILADTDYHIVVNYDGNGTPNANTVDLIINGNLRTLGVGGGSIAWFADTNKVLIGAVGATEELDGRMALEEVGTTEWTLPQAQNSYNQERHLLGR